MGVSVFVRLAQANPGNGENSFGCGSKKGYLKNPILVRGRKNKTCGPQGFSF